MYLRMYRCHDTDFNEMSCNIEFALYGTSRDCSGKECPSVQCPIDPLFFICKWNIHKSSFTFIMIFQTVDVFALTTVVHAANLL